AELIDTDTPFSSIGSDGARLDSEASLFATVALDGARLTLAWTTASSPAAKPIGVGLPLGVGDGLGVGLTVGLAVGLATGTGSRLAPVNIVTVAPDSMVAAGNI